MERLALVLLVCVIGLCQVSGQIVCADPNCLTCTAGTYNCTACNNAYNLDYRNFCVNCVEGFYFNSTTRKCEMCKQANCGSCDVNRCYNCISDYGLNETSLACVACPPHSLYCFHNQTFNYMQVTECEANYYANDSRHCIACPHNMTHCLQCNNATTCALCDTGYYVSSTTRLCTACNDHCLECSQFSCDICDVGYGVDLFGNCTVTTCSAAFCSSVGQMILPERNGFDCVDACDAQTCCGGVALGWIGVYVYGPDIATPCDNFYVLNVVKPGCNVGTVGAQSTNYTCFSNGTFLIEDGPIGQQQCLPGSFAGSGVVGDCTPNNGPIFGFNSVILQCTDTPRCDVHCTTCINGTCRGCLDGFFLQGSTCTGCAANCNACSSPTQCTDCADGYYVDATNGCTACSTANCSACDSQDQCNNCNAGNAFNFINNTCVWIPANATQVDFAPNGTLIVLRCRSGYYVADTQQSCVVCPDGCSRCNNATDCTRCSGTAYRNATGGCSTCDSAIKDCADCQLQGTVVWCNQCIDGKGFVNEPQKCASCSSSYNCGECLSYNYNPKTGCISCKSGYTFVPEHPNRRCYDQLSAANMIHPSIFGLLMMALATYLL